MTERARRKKLERILDYIAKQEQRCCWSGTVDQQDSLRLAWWTVWFAGYQDSPQPFDAALRKVLGPRYRNYLRERNLIPLPMPAAAPDEVHEVDGRNGSQWVRSVLAYLDWRAGHAWRPASDRNHPVRRTYTEASLEVRTAQNNPLPPKRPTKSRPAVAAITRKLA